MERAIVPAVVLLILALYVAKLVRSRAPRGPSRAIVVLDENRWLCEQLLHFGFSECHGIPSRTPRQHVEVVTSDDVDTSVLLASSDFFVIGEANDALLRLDAAQGDEWGRAELQPLLDALSRRFNVDANRTVLFPGAPPRSLVGAFDLSIVSAVLERAAKPRLAVLPTWCVFERVVLERNATSYVFMPDNWNLNHHGAFIVAKMIADRFLGADARPSLANVTLPDNMDRDTAQFLWDASDDCYLHDQAKSATTPA